MLYFKGRPHRKGAPLVAPCALVALFTGWSSFGPVSPFCSVASAQTSPPAAAAQASEQDLSLDTALSPDTLWDTPIATFLESHKSLGFRWLTAAKDSAQITRKGITYLGMPVGQTVVRTKDDKIIDVMAQLYNRGDHGELSHRDFDALLLKAREKISAALQVQPVNRGRDATSAVKAEGIVWTTDKAVYLLEYSFVKGNQGGDTAFRAEFVRLELTPREEVKSFVAKAMEKPTTFRGLDHVIRDTATGDVEIKDIPMVDQGQKGYCVPAASERVLRYYGIRVDANELAQLANSSAEGGTSVNALIDSLKGLTARLRIRTRSLMELDYKQFNMMVDDYNRLAKRKGTDQAPQWGTDVSPTDTFSKMDADTLREARTKSKAGVDKFERLIQTHIDKGIPVLWSCILGVFQEPKRTSQTMGGHMRLIIGYNTKTKEIMFSDSWGNGHESKRLPLLDALSMTTGLATVEPL